MNRFGGLPHNRRADMLCAEMCGDGVLAWAPAGSMVPRSDGATALAVEGAGVQGDAPPALMFATLTAIDSEREF